MKVVAVLVSALLLLLCVLGTSGQGMAPFVCEIDVTSEQYAGLCMVDGQPALLQIPPEVFGQVSVEVVSSAYYNTQVCFMYGMYPTLDKSAFWKSGYCPSESFLNFKGNKQSQASCPKNPSASMPAGNVTALPLGPAAVQSFIPRTTDVASGDALGYYVAAAISDSTFTGKRYSCSAKITIRVTAPNVCAKDTYGQNCQAVTAVLAPSGSTSQVTYPVSVPASSWALFTFPFPYYLAPYFKLTTQWQTKGPVTTYLRWEGIPFVNSTNKQMTAYDQKTSGSAPKQTMTFGDPRPGRYYIAYQNTGTAAVAGNFSLTFLARCGKNNTYGQNCDITATPIAKLKPKNQGTVTSQKPTYILLDSSADLLVSLSTVALTAPTMFLGAGYIPNGTYFSVEANTGLKVNRITTGTAGQPVPWVVAVVAELQETIGFTIWQNSICYNNCSNNGYCPGGEGMAVEFNPTGECTCNRTRGKTTYENFACQTPNNHNFQLEYTILIAVGGAILLSIVIGVPIYCLVNKRKSQKSGYIPLP